jgi:methionine aminopeptidase
MKAFLKTPIENMLSHQIERFKTVGEKQIIQNPGEEQKSKAEKCTFEEHEVYTIDILVSSGEGSHFDQKINKFVQERQKLRRRGQPCSRKWMIWSTTSN